MRSFVERDGEQMAREGMIISGSGPESDPASGETKMREKQWAR